MLIIQKYQELDSTNNYAKSIVNKINEDLVIQANYQWAGKGNNKSTWHSSFEENLLMSYIFFPKNLEAAFHFYLSKAVCIALHSFLSQYSGDFFIKWPNDIYYKNDKIAGILIENTIAGNIIKASVIGIGLNINEEKFPRHIPHPISLRNIFGEHFEVDEIRDGLLKIIRKYLGYINNKYYKKLDQLYHSSLLGVDKNVHFRNTKESFDGIIKGVTTDGYLRVTKDGKERLVGFKEFEQVFELMS